MYWKASAVKKALFCITHCNITLLQKHLSGRVSVKPNWLNSNWQTARCNTAHSVVLEMAALGGIVQTCNCTPIWTRCWNVCAWACWGAVPSLLPKISHAARGSLTDRNGQLPLSLGQWRGQWHPGGPSSSRSNIHLLPCHQDGESCLGKSRRAFSFHGSQECHLCWLQGTSVQSKDLAGCRHPL